MSTSIHTFLSRNGRPKNVPFGFKYAPSEEELVQTLEEFVRGNLTREQLSSERSIDAREAISSNQGFHPLNLDWDPQKGMSDNVRYCCRRRPKASGNAKKKTKRETGRGKYWKNLGPAPEVCGGKAKMSKLKLEEDEITWIMHEYTLNDNSKDFQDWAICKIERKSKNNDKEKARRTSKEGTQDSGSGFNMQGQDCDEQIVELLQENSREFGTSEEGTEESGRRNMQWLEDIFNQEINDGSSMINTNDFSSLYKELEQITMKH